MPRLRREGRDAQIPAEKNAIASAAPHNARVPGTTSVISGTPGHYWLHKSGSDLAAATYSPTWWGSTIGARGLNFSVRYG